MLVDSKFRLKRNYHGSAEALDLWALLDGKTYLCGGAEGLLEDKASCGGRAIGWACRESIAHTEISGIQQEQFLRQVYVLGCWVKDPDREKGIFCPRVPRDLNPNLRQEEQHRVGDGWQQAKLTGSAASCPLTGLWEHFAGCSWYPWLARPLAAVPGPPPAKREHPFWFTLDLVRQLPMRKKAIRRSHLV